MASLVVIIGAGASHDCCRTFTVRRDEWRPPLVTGLFSEHRQFAEVLHEYPLAEAAASDIRPAISSGAVAIEQFLRERLRESSDSYAKRRYRQVPLYLQDLLFRISRTNGTGYTIHPDNYDALINAALALDDVVFVSLNYDTLLDQRLFAYAPLDSLDAYISRERNWCLIKLHGSVNWGRPAARAPSTYVTGRTDLVNRYFDQVGEEGIAGEIVLRNYDDLDRIRYDDDRPCYPALSVPLGTVDELVCPPAHVEYLQSKLQSLPTMNILVIGYSGLDQEVLRLLRESGRPPTVLMVVNGDAERGGHTAAAINRQFGSEAFLETQVFTGGFSEFVSGEHLATFFEMLP